MYHIFISHAWHRSEHYEKVVGWLNDSDISWANYSVPEEDPLHSGKKAELKRDLTNQISPCNRIIILSGMYAAHSEWIDYEIDEAVRLGKYIIGVKPWGQERIPKKIQDNASTMVGWNSSSVVNAVKDANK